jgi:putative ABC transport system permease protein
MIRDRNQVNRQAELWVPLPSTTSDRTRRGRFLSSIARLKDGVTIQQAQADMSGIAGRLEEEYPDFNKGWGVSLISLKDQMVGELQPTLLVLLGAVSFVLLIACANITNLLLVRAALRQGEFAIRAALGANHWRIIRQLLIESVLLASLGGLAGLLLARWGVGLLLALAPEGVLGLDAIGIDFRLLGFTLLATLITSIIFGLAPALESTRINLSDPLKGANKGRNTKGSHRLRNTFVVVEVALAFILLIGAGLMVKSFLRLQAVNPGFEASNLLTARLALPTSKYSQSQRIAFFKTLLQRVRALPGVRSVGAISHLPFSGSGAGTWFTIVGRPAPAAGEKPSADVRVIDPSYFAAMGIPIPHGRNFSEKEASEPSHVVIINETMARQYWPNEDPIGQKVVIEMSDQPVPSEIIGVVGDVKHKGLSDKTNPMVYWPHPELPFPLLTLVIRTDSSPLNLSAALRSEVLAVDRDQPIADLRTMEQLLSNSIGRQRLGTLLIGIFAVVAVILASVGVYGLIAQSVTERTQEIGIRIALGAQTRDVLKLIIGHGLKLVLCGVAIGLIGAFALTRFLTTILYTVSTTDYTTFLLISLLLFAIALIASYVPARRAIKVDPVIALRYE